MSRDDRLREDGVRSVCPTGVPAPRSTYHYIAKRPPQDVLRKRIRELAETHVRYGYRRIHILLQREGWLVNIKRVRRLYNLEGLQMRLKPPRRRVMAKLRSDRSDATGPNQVWAMDWMFDETFDGKRLLVLTMIDTLEPGLPGHEGLPVGDCDESNLGPR